MSLPVPFSVCSTLSRFVFTSMNWQFRCFVYLYYLLLTTSVKSSQQAMSQP